MIELQSLIEKLGQSQSTVFLNGESGTGKELVASAIHQAGPRKTGPFVPVNCIAIAEGILEAELFGHTRGSFTGAVQNKTGLFEAANGGTLFLDEIAEIAPTLQAKLLRVLQEKAVRPVGSLVEKPVDVRIITATNRNIDKALIEGRLRKDLFYRLDVFRIQLPPLRERVEDIPLLVAHFIQKHAGRKPHRGIRIAPDAMDALLAYDWPGNVRQLENTLIRAITLKSGQRIYLRDLPPEIVAAVAGSEPDTKTYNLRKNEISLIRKALRVTGGNKRHATELLGINLSTLYRKINRYRI